MSCSVTFMFTFKIESTFDEWAAIFDSAEAIAAQRPAMIAHLDEVRGFMEELSPELGVTDPVSGIIVSKVGYHD